MQSSIVEPLLLFCAHAIRMHDGRCCGVVLRVFRSIVPEFHMVETVPPEHGSAAGRDPAQKGTAHGQVDNFPVPQATANAVREFISNEVLKACITSLHEPYFVDVQKDIGSLIAYILVYFSPLTSTPKEVLLSLPDMKAHEVDHTIANLMRPGLSARQQRAMVLDLLKDLKGVSISEMGKLSKSGGVKAGGGRSGKRSTRSKMAQEFMTAPTSVPAAVDASGGGDGAAAGGDSRRTPDLEGVSGLFQQDA